MDKSASDIGGDCKLNLFVHKQNRKLDFCPSDSSSRNTGKTVFDPKHLGKKQNIPLINPLTLKNLRRKMDEKNKKLDLLEKDLENTLTYIKSVKDQMTLNTKRVNAELKAEQDKKNENILDDVKKQIKTLNENLRKYNEKKGKSFFDDVGDEDDDDDDNDENDNDENDNDKGRKPNEKIKLNPIKIPKNSKNQNITIPENKNSIEKNSKSSNKNQLNTTKINPLVIKANNNTNITKKEVKVGPKENKDEKKKVKISAKISAKMKKKKIASNSTLPTVNNKTSFIQVEEKKCIKMKLKKKLLKNREESTILI